MDLIKFQLNKTVYILVHKNHRHILPNFDYTGRNRAFMGIYTIFEVFHFNVPH